LRSRVGNCSSLPLRILVNGSLHADNDKTFKLLAAAAELSHRNTALAHSHSCSTAHLPRSILRPAFALTGCTDTPIGGIAGSTVLQLPGSSLDILSLLGKLGDYSDSSFKY
jgi:hypothetical protein